ncbi:MAG: pyridoxine 5'-phosphate synthase [Candidatus Azobacteroides sp.]|nr:pyridoxine 5'-phosphate synthase [Candidatus Azobacteroides sp.]
MVKLSININKVATLRNARGGNVPNVIRFAVDCEKYGAEGITVHPRPDGRHIKYEDVYALKPVLKTEFNIEGYPSDSFLDLVLKIHPEQVTLVPDPPEAITSSAGWDTKKNESFLTEIVELLKNAGIRSSVFIDTDLTNIEYAAKVGTDRIELYTEPYASGYKLSPAEVIHPFVEAAKFARQMGLGINAGHDLNLDNLHYLSENIPWLEEVSIGHALIADALYSGIEKTIEAYKNCLR